ncbi:DUF4190 domain-containing protein [Nocardioides sp. SYSU D00038]|uniref:DUF4190 domain-containing protein n=1 Tax=Nocardioides sp. SYSU D00038 TaxID=2812554 RepID=UPI0019688C09|nr:DUF4190 domain-containing protein [Nocardioides sp. SYSU D00038]
MSYNEPPPPPDYGQQPPGYGSEPPTYGSQPPGYGQQPPAPPGGGGNNQKAVISLVLGIISVLCCGFFTGIPAVILAQMAKTEIAQNRQEGSGLATAGFVLGIIGSILGVIQVILALNGVTFYGDI